MWKDIEYQMDITQTIIELGRRARKEENIPIRDVCLCVHIPILYEKEMSYRNLENMYKTGDLYNCILNELNIRYVDFIDGNKFNYKYKLDFKKLAKDSPSLVKEYTLLMKEGKSQEIDNKYLIKEYDGFKQLASYYNNGIVLALNSNINSSILRERQISKIVKEIKTYRKENIDDVSKIINYTVNEELNIKEINYIQQETLSILNNK